MIQRSIMGTQVPALIWADDVEPNCIEQIVNLASLPFAVHHVSIMPDAHTGHGMPIGGVLATKGVIIPNAVGVDIGCGMCAMRTSLKASDLERKDITTVMGHIRKHIPLGFNHRKKAVDEAWLPEGDLSVLPRLSGLRESLLKEIGTLGGGNHFIEIQKDTTTDDVWVMIHSGSRNVGAKVAKHYNELAETLCKRWFSNYIPGLAFLPMEEEAAHNYKAEMEYCIKVAHANRSFMMEQIKDGFRTVREQVEFDPFINIAHNYAAEENHFGEEVIVHRKGATRAYKGEIGIIPGSMGTKSYIVEGLGNPLSFMSCSHGSGRKLSRSVAFQNLDLQQECRQMDEKGIIHGMRKDGLDEAPGAYKDVEHVIALEDDLVKPIIELFPLASVKG